MGIDIHRAFWTDIYFYEFVLWNFKRSILSPNTSHVVYSIFFMNVKKSVMELQNEHFEA